MLEQWQKLGMDVHELKSGLETLVDILPQSTTFYKQSKSLNKIWRSFQKNYNLMDQYITPVKSVKVISALLDDPEFKLTWNLWKEYLSEQHAISLKSRAELMSLKRLSEIANADPKTAIHFLEHAIARISRNFYVVKGEELAAQSDSNSKTSTVSSNTIKVPVHYLSKSVKAPEKTKPAFVQKNIHEEIKALESKQVENAAN